MAVVGVGRVVDALAVVRFALKAKHRKIDSPPGWVELKYFGSGYRRLQTINPRVGLFVAAFAAALDGGFGVGFSLSLTCVLSVVVGLLPSPLSSVSYCSFVLNDCSMKRSSIRFVCIAFISINAFMSLSRCKSLSFQSGAPHWVLSSLILFAVFVVPGGALWR